MAPHFPLTSVLLVFQRKQTYISGFSLNKPIQEECKHSLSKVASVCCTLAVKPNSVTAALCPGEVSGTISFTSGNGLSSPV